jgi:glyoxylase-like metal-dependent hydrolase (beta-lactamase superfamily II)
MNARLKVWVLLLGLLAGAAAAQAATPCADALPWQRVAAGVWSWSPAAEAEISHANAGHVVPTTVVLHGGDALLIDPGPSHAHGQRVRRSLACRFGAQVRWIVNTHAHAENVLGNSAFADRVAAGSAEILASAATRAGMAQRCPDCLASLTDKAGADAMVGTRIVLPTRTLAEGDVLRVGPYRLEVRRIEQGHTDGDLVLWDAQRRLLWTGGLVYGQRVPELAQGSLDGWLVALDRLAALRPRVVVGNVVSLASDANSLPPALTGTQAYLSGLRAAVLNAMDQGLQASDATSVTLPAYSPWAGHAERQGFNAQRAWRELEPKWMELEVPAK